MGPSACDASWARRSAQTLLGSRSRRSWAGGARGKEARQSHPSTIAVAKPQPLHDRTAHRPPVIRALRNHRLVVAPTGHVGLRRASCSWAIVTERGGLPKWLGNHNPPPPCFLLVFILNILKLFRINTFFNC